MWCLCCVCAVSGTEEETEMAANCLWLVTNSKPCPNCKSPIQKNEGCNHMKCSKVQTVFLITQFTHFFNLHYAPSPAPSTLSATVHKHQMLQTLSCVILFY